jgi:hypothetical protein
MARLPEKPPDFMPDEWAISAGALNKMIAAITRQFFGGKNVEVQYFGDRVRIGSKFDVPFRRDVAEYLCQFIVLEEFDDYLKCMPYVIPVDTNSLLGHGVWQPYLLGNIHNHPIQGQNATVIVDLSETIPIYVAKPYALQKTPWQFTNDQNSAFHSYTPPPSGTDDEDDVRDYWTPYSWHRGLKYTSRNRREVRLEPSVDARQDEVDKQIVNPPYIRNELIDARIGATSYYDPNGVPIAWTDINTAGRTWQSEHQQYYAFRVSNLPPPSGNEAFKVITMPGGKTVRAFACRLWVPDGTTGLTGDNVAVTTGGAPIYSGWLVPTVHGNTVYPGKWYPCWKGPAINSTGVQNNTTDYQLYYTQGEPKSLMFQSLGSGNFKMVITDPIGGVKDDLDYEYSYSGSFLEYGPHPANSFFVTTMFSAGGGLNLATGLTIRAKFNYFLPNATGFSIVADQGLFDQASGSVSVPTNSTDTGVAGTWTKDNNFLYLCIATNTWRRIAMGTF